MIIIFHHQLINFNELIFIPMYLLSLLRAKAIPGFPFEE